MYLTTREMLQGKHKQCCYENHVLTEVGQQQDSQASEIAIATTKKFKEPAAGDTKMVISSITEKLYHARKE